MSAALDWYFDVISPFAYLQWRRLRRDHADVALNPKPVLLAAILNHVGQLGPAEIPQKRRHTYRIVLWQARQYQAAAAPVDLPVQWELAKPSDYLAAIRALRPAGHVGIAADYQALQSVLARVDALFHRLLLRRLALATAMARELREAEVQTLRG